MNFQYYIPTKIHFGPGTLANLGKETLPGKRALLVVSAGSSMKKLGYLDRVQALLRQNGTEFVLFDKILPNPIKKHVMEGAAIAKSERCDFVIGLGGGSTIDSAKSIAVMAKNPGDYWDYVSGGTGKGQPVINGALPIVAITTTAGTGTEADPWTVITHEERQEKIGFGLVPATFPVLSIVDPELMLSVPPRLTAFQGFDAFFHAAEGILANIATPLSDAFAAKAIELIAKSLPAAVANGTNLEARTDVALANTLAGMVESTSCCTSEHSLAHALSAYHPELPHGAALIMVSVPYFKFFAEKAPDRAAIVAAALGSHSSAQPSAACSVVTALKHLQDECGVGNLRMSDYGVKKDQIPKYAKNAFDTMGFLFTLDRYKLSTEDAVHILEAAYR